MVHHGMYLTPYYTSTVESVVALLKDRPRRAKLMVAGDININLEEPEGDWRE